MAKSRPKSSKAVPPKRPLTVSRSELLHNGTDTDFRSLVHDLLSLSQQIQSIREVYAKTLGLSGTQYTIVTVIAQLQGESGVAVKTVAKHLHSSGSFVTTEVVRLVELGLVAKGHDTADRRRVPLSLTPRGWKLFETIAPVRRQVNDVLFGGLSRADFMFLSRVVERLVENGEHAKLVLQLLRGRSNNSAVQADISKLLVPAMMEAEDR